MGKRNSDVLPEVFRTVLARANGNGSAAKTVDEDANVGFRRIRRNHTSLEIVTGTGARAF